MATNPGVSRTTSHPGQALAFGLAGVGLGLAMIAAKDSIYQVQGGVSNLAEFLPFGYAYAAGMVAAFNPCGILLVPSLVAYYLGSDEVAGSGWWSRASRALVFGVSASLGFVALFGGVGLILVVGGRALG